MIWNNIKRRKSSLALAAGLLLMGATVVQAQDAVEGKKVFEANCTVCHSMDADVVGPALKDVHQRRGDEWLVKFIQNSQDLVKSGDKDAVAVFEKFGKVPMPSFASSLSEQDITNVIAYIKEASAAPAQAEAAPAATADNAAATPGAAVEAEVSFMELPLLVHVTI
ncbi:MAG: cytochrome c, partial [Hymenobacteraceae bacterium]|nr:cytochrome c [Hymenobacteraceae bacterium]